MVVAEAEAEGRGGLSMYGQRQQELLQAMGFTLYRPAGGPAPGAQTADAHWHTPLGRNVLRHLQGIAAPALVWPADAARAEGKRGLWRQVRALQRAR